MVTIPQKVITTALWYGVRGDQVMLLQNILKEQGYLHVGASGYYGALTMRAVLEFQKAHQIDQTGYVGPRTREALNKNSLSIVEETFEGTITAYSTGCFADGVCSITVDGKTIVTTIGRAQGPIGQVMGITDFSTIESKIGTRAKVYAKKTTDGYTLYGNAGYYIVVE